MHARAAAKFVGAANLFQSDIRISKGGKPIDGKSIVGIMMLAAAKGDTVTISAKGADAREALDALCTLVGKKFGEEENEL